MQIAAYCNIRILLDLAAASGNIGHTVLFMFVLPTRSRWSLLLAALLLHAWEAQRVTVGNYSSAPSPPQSSRPRVPVRLRVKSRL